jgi:hypothetical protein
MSHTTRAVNGKLKKSIQNYFAKKFCKGRGLIILPLPDPPQAKDRDKYQFSVVFSMGNETFSIPA